MKYLSEVDRFRKVRLIFFLEHVRLTLTKVSDRIEIDTSPRRVLDPESSSADYAGGPDPRRNVIEAGGEVLVTREGSVDIIWLRGKHSLPGIEPRLEAYSKR